MKIINIIYKFLDKNQFTRLLMDILSFIIRKIKIKEIDEENLINIEGIKEMNISKSWFTEKKEIGISGIARIKNGDDFLEKVIESYIQFLDEIILINNKSTDQSKLICINLEKKYKNKVKFFDYDFDVLPPGTSINIPDNSIKSFVYFSNRCFSKSKYKYAMKIDDDNLFDKKKGKKIREYIINKKPNRYINYWGYNLLKNKKGIIGISEENKYIGRYGDHGIFPISKYTYFSKGYDNGGYNEYFNNNLLIKRFDFSFYHLKYLKKNYGLTNVLNTKSGKLYYNMVERGKIIELKDKEILKIIK